MTIYPVLELYLTHTDGRRWIVPSGCFHALTEDDDLHLAGMGLALIGNLTKLLGSSLYDPALSAELVLRRWPTDEGIVCPWPGMPDDQPIPLDLTQLPFDPAMFFDRNGDAKKRLDRLALMARIRLVWVPWLREHLEKTYAS